LCELLFFVQLGKGWGLIKFIMLIHSLINLILPENIVIALYLRRWYCRSIFIQIFLVALRKRMHFETECNGRSNSSKSLMTLAPIESAYATSHWLSIVTLVISCTVSEILQVFYWKQHSTPIPSVFWGCSLWTRLPICWVSEERRPYATYSCNYFRISPIYMPSVPQHYRQTDGQTDDLA